MDKLRCWWKWANNGKPALLILTILMILGRADQSWAGSGLDAAEPIGPYLNGKLPSKKPQSGSGSWALVDAFPGLSFTNPLFMTSLPGTNNLLMLEHQGLVYSFANDPSTTTKQLVLDIRARVQDTHWGGLLSMAFHPQFGQNGSPNREYVYLTYRYEHQDLWSSANHKVPGYLRLSRFNYSSGTGRIDPNSELVLIQQYDTSKHHLGGSITFGNDGFLYLSRGDEYCCNDPTNATQKLNVGLFSGMLRIDVDMDASRSHPIRRQPLDNSANRPSGWPASFTQGYYIPNDNPWQDPSGGILEEFYAIGFRSPHVISLDAPTGNIWIADVGEAQREEIDLLKKGANFQWPFKEGNNPGPKSKPGTVIGIETPPVAEYGHNSGANCIIGGHIYRGSEHASSLGGKFLFADNGNQQVWAMSYDSGSGTGQIETLCTGPSGGYYTGISGSGRDANGEVYFLKMSGHDNGNGKIMKLTQSQTSQPEPPALLSQTGAFSNLATLAVAPGLLAYEVNTPLYSDGAEKQRWFAIPNNGSHNSAGEKIGFSENGNWTFPAGAVLMKHFDMPIDERNPDLLRRMETRFMILGADGEYFGFTYRWRPDGSDADLLYDGMDETVQVRTSNGSLVNQAWHYPSRSECFSCHSAAAGYVLGPRTRQLNRDQTYSKTGRTENQLETLNHLGIFSPAIDPARLPGVLTSKPMGDSTSSWQKRALSYLDSNCSHCHQPGGTAHANFDARLSTSPFSQGLVNTLPNNNLGISGARVIAPGDTSRSVLYHRANTLGFGAMPPLAKNHIDDGAITLLEKWIVSIDASVTPPNPSTSDVREPIATLTAPSQIAGNFTVEVTFNEPVYGLTTDDFAVTHGAASGLTGSGASYLLSVAATAGANNVTVSLPSDQVIDAGANANAPSNVVTSTVAALPVVSLASASANETTGVVQFMVALSTASSTGVSVQFNTIPGSATATADYQSRSGTLSIPAGSTSGTIQVPVIDDLMDEPSETFTLQLSNASGATLGTSSTSGTITDNDAAPSITIADSAQGESASALPFQINLSHPSAFPVSVYFESMNGTATAGHDYIHAAAPLEFQPGQTQLTIAFGISKDVLDEEDEFFIVRLSGAANATIADAEGIGTIVDDDITPTLSIEGGSAGESTGTLNFLVQLSAASGAAVQVHYAAAPRSATPGTDYTSVNGTLTVPAGLLTANLAVAIIDDGIDEMDEDFSVTLSAPVNAVLGISSAVGTIIDDDLAILSVASAETTESAGALPFSVYLSAASENTVFANYRLASGSAEAADDFEMVSGTLTMAAGQTTATIAVNILDDSVFEMDETFTLLLSSPVNAALGQAIAIGTIQDNDPAPAITIGNASASELSGHVDLPVTLSAPSNGATAFQFLTTSDTAQASADFEATSGTLTIPAGATTGSITIPILDDQIIEQNESFTVLFANPQSGTLSSESATVTILDDEAGAQISIEPSGAEEGDTAIFILSLSGLSSQSISVDYAITAETASPGTDFIPLSGVLVFPAQQQQVTLQVPLLDDGIDEPTETLRVLLSNPINATLAVTSAEGEIVDNDETPAISLSPATAEEGEGELLFELQLSNVSGQEVTANYEIRPGTADAADFESRSGTVHIPAGRTGATIGIHVTDDRMDELAETLVLTVISATNATVSDNNALGTIFDDDQPPSIHAATTSASEGEEGITFQIALSERSGKDVFVDWSMAGVTAEAGRDFVPASGTITLPAGSQTATVTAPLLEDDLPEPAETLTLLLSNPENATISEATAGGTILDDDAIPTLNVNLAAVREGEGDLEFLIKATGIHAAPMTVQVDVTSGVAEAGSDFAPVSTLVQIAPGETSAIVRVEVFDDTLAEGTESAVIALSSPTNATLGRSQTIGYIYNNDDPPEISVADAVAGESENVLTFPVTLSTASGREVSISWKTRADSAATGADFTAAEGTLKIPAGATEASISIALLDDGIYEGDETLSLELTEPVYLTMGRRRALGTITDDETIPSLAIDSSIVSEATGKIALTVSASNASTEPVSVAYATVEGTADNRDFTSVSGVLTLAPGQISATIDIIINDDKSDEPNETFRIDLTNPGNATIAMASGSGTILDDDTPPAISISADTANEQEGTLIFPVRLSTVSAFSVEVSYAIQSVSAEAGSDYESAEGVLVIAPGTESTAIRVTLIDDGIDEDNETVSAVLSAPVRAQIADSSALGTIEDNDAAPEISIESARAFESAQSIGLRLTLSAPSAKNISMDCLTRGNTAVEGVDFYPETGPISIPAGATAALIVIPLIPDELNEPEETFNVILSNPSNASILNAVGTGSILDDDEMPSLTIGNASIKESAGSIVLPVTLSAASGQRVQVSFVTKSVTATMGTDFVAKNGTVVFEPGITQGTVTVPLIDDKDAEKPEQLVVLLSNPRNATIADGKGLGFIGDDDREDVDETRPRAIKAYSQGRLTWTSDPDTGDRYLDYVVPNIPELDRFDVAPELSTNFIDWKQPSTGDWYIEREGETIHAVIRARGNERSQFVRFVLIERE